MASEVKIPTVEPHTSNSIFGVSEKWSIIPATYMIEGKRNVAGVEWGTGICRPRCGETVGLVRPQ